MTTHEGAKKTLWFNEPQLLVLQELVRLTGDSNSLIVRKALDEYLMKIKSEQARNNANN